MKRIIAILFLISTFCSCTKEITQPKEVIKRSFLFRIQNLDNEITKLSEISCYIFKDDLLYEVLNNLPVESTEQQVIETPPNSKLYFLANIDVPPSPDSLKEGKTTLASFLSLQSAHKDDNQQGEVAEFYSGTADSIHVDEKINMVKLYNSVSRIDIDASSSKLIRIDSTKIKDISATTRLFKSTETYLSAKQTDYQTVFEPAGTGMMNDVFRVYESNTPVTLTILGHYDNIPFTCDKEISRLERGKIYTIKIEEENIKLPDNIHIITPDARGRLDMDAKQASLIQPGDIVYLRGNFLSIRITGFKGTSDLPITVANYPGEQLVIGDPDWQGGAYSSALQLMECRHIILGGNNTASDFLIEGSVTPKRAAYFGINLRPFTDHVEVKNITIRNGGVGIIAKTDPEKNKPETWYPNTLLENLSVHDLIISDTEGEAMYIGHSSIWWGWDENGKGYNAGAKPENPSHTFVRPILWKNVRIYRNYVYNLGYDGIQTSTIDQLEIYENEVAHFGLKKAYGQCMGILVGGRTSHTKTHDNYIHDGYGEIFQFHGAGEGNSTHLVHNNLLVNSQSNGMGIYGSTDDATIDISNNTIVNCYSFAVQANGKNYKTTVQLHDNVFISCYQQDSLSNKYIRVMNNARVEQNENKQFYTISDAKVDPDNLYCPLPGSTIGNAGFKIKK